MRLGIVGFGKWVQAAHVAAIRQVEGIRVVGVSDVDQGKLRVAEEKFGYKVYQDYLDLLAKESPDMVLVATPHVLHCEVAERALELGASVYVEKPLSVNVEDALRVVELARRREAMLVVGHEYRLYNAYLAARRLVQSGRLGRIYHARSLILRRMGIPTSPTFIKRDLAYGGALLDIGCHILDIFLFLTGFPLPLSAKGSVQSIFSSRPEMFSSYPAPPVGPQKVEVDDFAAGFVCYEGGVTMNLEVSWAAYLKDDAIETVLLGDRGGIDVGNQSLNYMTTLDQEYMVSQSVLGQQQQAYPTIWASIADSFSKGDKRVPYPLATGEQAFLNIAVIHAVYRSSKEGREVPIDIPKSIGSNLGW